MGYALEGSIICPEMTNEGGVAVYVARRADLFRNLADRHLFTIEFAISIFETMHPANLH